MAENVGPWKRADIHSLNELYAAARRLDEPQGVGLFFPSPSSSPFASRTEAVDALHGHPIYKWFGAHAPAVLAVNADEFELVHTLVEGMAAGFAQQHQLPREESTRSDKKRKTVGRAIERVRRSLDDGTIVLANSVKQNVLRQLLEEAQQDVATPSAKSVKHPALAALVESLYRQFRVTDVTVIMAIITAMEIADIDERTARRYIEVAASA
jgi:hypothetical protein